MYPLQLAIGVVLLLQSVLNANPVLALLCLIVGACAIFLALWPRLILSDDGATVINLNKRTLRWDEIAGAQAHVKRGTVNLVLSLTDGSELRALAMRGSAGGILASRELVEGVAAEIDQRARQPIRT